MVCWASGGLCNGLKVLGFIGMLIVIAIAGGIGKELGRSSVTKLNSDRTEGAIEEALRQASNQVNSGLPMMVDKETRLDSTMPGPGKRWTYLYTITSTSSSEVSQQQLQNALGSNIKSYVCSNKDMVAFVKNGVQIIYKYRGNDGKIIGDIIVNPQDCT